MKLLSHESETHVGPHFLRRIAEEIGIRRLRSRSATLVTSGAALMTPFQTADTIMPCNELSIEAASISGQHAKSDRAEDATAMRLINSSC